MFHRAVKEGRENGMSLEHMGLDYLLSVNEYLDIQAALEEDYRLQSEARNKK